MNYIIRRWTWWQGEYVLVLDEYHGWDRKRIARAHRKALAAFHRCITAPTITRGKPRLVNACGARRAKALQYDQCYQ